MTKRRELEIAAAVAREAIMQYHVTSAARLIALAADRVSVVRMLDIYMRLHGLTGAQAELLAYRVLASLGHSAANGTSLIVQGEDGPSDSGSLLRVVRDRLRGRIHHDLRRWVELATGQAQAGLLEIHVRHAMRFAQDLADGHSVAQACTLYVEMAGVPATLKDALYIMLLDKLAGEELPRRALLPPAESERVTLHPPARQSRNHRRPA